MEHAERERLHDILNGIAELLARTRHSRQELNRIKADIVRLYENEAITAFRYDIEMEDIKRAHKDIDVCIKDLERQKKQALLKLRGLGQ
jgi:hypothetical protein